MISLTNHSHTYSACQKYQNNYIGARICLNIVQYILQHARIPLKTVKPADSPTKMTLNPSLVLAVWMGFILTTMEIAQASST